MAEKTSVRHYECGTGNALYRAILDEPGDVLRRLVMADYLEEQGEADRAEFIRLQHEEYDERAMRLWDLLNGQRDWFADICKWTGNATTDWGVCDDGSVHYDGKHRLAEFWVRRGFVEEIACPMVWWIGGECECFTNEPDAGCPHCNGAGRTPAHGPEVVARHPVTTVVVTDLEPWSDGPGSTWFSWVDDSTVAVAGLTDARHYIPHDVYVRIRRHPRCPSGLATSKRYPSRETAFEALSDALVDVARESAGLRQLVRKVEV